MTLPLQGLRVLEVAEYGMVPTAGVVLAEWGAEVIKVEQVATGDPTRGITAFGVPPGTGGFTFLWEVFNRGKRSIGIDLKTASGRELALELAKSADVFLTSFLPAARRKLGIEPEDVQAANPKIIYARGSAVGQAGSEAENGGFDSITYWCRSGAAAASMPARSSELVGLPGPGFGDIQTGMALAGGIAAALFHRERTGQGVVVDTSLLSSACWAMAPSLLGANVAGLEQLPPNDTHDAWNPLSNFYRTSDDRFIALAMIQADRYWTRFCEVIGEPALLTDERFSDIQSRGQNRRACIAYLDKVFASKPLAHWVGVLRQQQGQWTVVQRVGDLNNDEQAWANGYLQRVDYGDGRVATLGTSPIQFDGTPPALRRAPEHAEHTEDVLLEYGKTWDDIIQLKVDGAIT